MAPGERADLRVPLAAGRYVADAAGVASVPFAWTAGSQTARITTRVSDDRLEGIPPEATGDELALAIESGASREVIFKVVKSEWPDTITTAAQVTALQDFRDLFSSEVLATGLELGIRSMTVLFTDLVGSTELYSKTGDAPAFRIVQDHFGHMREVIAEKNGAIIKTIGDAVMAVFVSPLDAYEAALRLPPAVGMVRTPHGPLMLRVGFHSGPCIAMRANDRLDYFGTTVNLAARIQHIANGGEVALSASTASLSEIAAKIRERRETPVRESIRFKGFAQEIEIVRLTAMTA
ncbi:MAG: adenylate/guanylate cyclase domain-containing protein [Candidatus Eremiobacteraeota bacterium]|nr:adenylate/guanylate cyclase domain-containing protein [Candidatus Eremiobacteraeota bacterium]